MVPVRKPNLIAMTNVIEERTDELFQVDYFILYFKLFNSTCFFFRVGIHMEMVVYINKIFFDIVYRFI